MTSGLLAMAGGLVGGGVEAAAVGETGGGVAGSAGAGEVVVVAAGSGATGEMWSSSTYCRVTCWGPKGPPISAAAAAKACPVLRGRDSGGGVTEGEGQRQGSRAGEAAGTSTAAARNSGRT